MSLQVRGAVLGILLVLLLVAGPVSAALVNLTPINAVDRENSLSPGLGYTLSHTKWEMAELPFSTVEEDSAIMWIRSHSLPTSGVVVYTLTMNDQTSILGTIQAQDTSLISSRVTTTLGGVTSTADYTRLPYIGVIPEHVITYGVDPAGTHYLVLLPKDRTGSSPYDPKIIQLDTTRDPHMVISAPVNNPIIHLQKSSGSTPHFVDIYTATMTYLQTGPEESDDYIGQFLGLLGGLGAIFVFCGQFIITYWVYLPLAMVLGEGLLFLHCLKKKPDIVQGLGLFAQINLEFADIFQRVLTYGFRILYWAWDAVMKWL